MKLEPYMPTRVLYIITMFLVSIILVAFAWFTMHYFLVTLQPICTSVAERMGSNSTTYNQVDTFFSGLDNWLGIVALLALVIGCYQYSQRRGQMI